MENISVFDFLDYRLYLQRAIRAAPKKGRGMKGALAVAAGCQGAYLSRVLVDKADLSLEQADAMSVYLGHSPPESRYFLFCVQYARAGTARLRAHFRNELEEIRQKRTVLKERFQIKTLLSGEDQAIYYSSWLYAATHMAASTTSYGTKEALSHHLGLSVSRVSEILEFLLARGLLVFENGRFRLGAARIHLGSDSPFISKHHMNWRVQSLRSLDREGRSQQNEDLHYTSIVSLGREDHKKLKAMLLKAIDEFNALVEPSPEEEVHCLALDFFKI